MCKLFKNQAHEQRWFCNVILQYLTLICSSHNKLYNVNRKRLMILLIYLASSWPPQSQLSQIIIKISIYDRLMIQYLSHMRKTYNNDKYIAIYTFKALIDSCPKLAMDCLSLHWPHEIQMQFKWCWECGRFYYWYPCCSFCIYL